MNIYTVPHKWKTDFIFFAQLKNRFYMITLMLGYHFKMIVLNYCALFYWNEFFLCWKHEWYSFYFESIDNNIIPSHQNSLIIITIFQLENNPEKQEKELVLPSNLQLSHPLTIIYDHYQCNYTLLVFLRFHNYILYGSKMPSPKHIIVLHFWSRQIFWGPL